MPYNPAGLFSLIASYFATPGATIRTEQHNPIFEDVASALSSVLLRDGRAPMTGALNMNGFPINNAVAGSTSSSVATLAQSVPIGGVIDFAGSTAPIGWALCYGQAVSRITYAALFAVIGVTYGVGDGSTTFNLPDLRGRVSAGRDDMGGTAANRLTPTYFGSGITLGAAGGVESHTLTASESAVLSYPVIQATYGAVIRPQSNTTATNSGFGVSGIDTTANNPINLVTPASVTSNAGGGAHRNVQPTLILSKIIRVSYDV